MKGTMWRLSGTMAAVMVAVAGTAAIRGEGVTGAQQRDESAIAVLQDAAGATVGQVTFTRQGDSVRVQADAYNLPPGFHGFHVHATGACDAAASAAFTSAGGHLNTGAHDHGHHAGDMPVLYVKADGSGSLAFVGDGYVLADLFDADGSAVIVHAAPDNYANIPTRYAAAPDAMTLATGDAGGRIACGVVEAASARGRR